MRLFQYVNRDGQVGVGAANGAGQSDLGLGTLALLLAEGRLQERLEQASTLDMSVIRGVPLTTAARTIFCIGLNYADHRAEAEVRDPPLHPDVFLRIASSFVGPEEPLFLPAPDAPLDFEGELGLMIGRAGYRISREEAMSHVAGYFPLNDGSLRDLQFRASQWTLGKNGDRTGACAVELVTPDDLPRPVEEGLAIETRLNGEVVQSASTNQLIFDIPHLIATLSEAITLQPGDVIATGTPAGVGLARTPPLFMRDGDVVEVEIEGVGLLRNPVRLGAVL